MNRQPPDPVAPELTGAAPSKRRLETRARILTAAAEVFADLGFGRATVENVCDRAGFTRGAFYSNFASLDELFFALQTSRADELVATVQTAVTRAVDDGHDRPPTLASVIKIAVAELPINRDTQLLSLEFSAHALRHPDVATALAKQRNRLFEALVPVLREGLDALGTTADESELLDAARVVVAVHEALSLQELIEPANSTLSDLRLRVLTTLIGEVGRATKNQAANK